MLYVRIVDGDNQPVDIDDLTDTGIGQAIYDSKNLIDKLEDKHRELMDESE